MYFSLINLPIVIVNAVINTMVYQYFLHPLYIFDLSGNNLNLFSNRPRRVVRTRKIEIYLSTNIGIISRRFA